ncbi:hypothetical protein ABIC98_000210 [Arthrobacter nitrophenolicus]|uniref:Uncharacterized protein n=1 Tax=Arthrobacter nitrophenolicus TaxID=683150 RepID=A0ACC6TA36_9MICC
MDDRRVPVGLTRVVAHLGVAIRRVPAKRKGRGHLTEAAGLTL